MGDSYIIAIDFGTSYSGYAFSITSREQEPEPQLKYWGKTVGRETPKTPTCILFDQDEEFESFGYKAKEMYMSKRGNESRDGYFFSCFKMALYDKKINKDLMIKASNGKEMKALKVFTEALRYLKDDAVETINANVAGVKLIASDFTWVLTVPAIWEPSAKEFMREAAAQAGMVSQGYEDKLLIALEPEAASVFCKKLPSDGFIAEHRGGGKLDQSSGTKYIVVDCGGGTIDITVHEVLEGGALRELHKASGNNLGGQTVDRKFKEFLREVFSVSLWDDYEANYPSELQSLMYDFTMFKQNDDDVEIPCPFNLGKLAQKKKKMKKFFKKVEGASWDEGAITICKQKLRSFFEESLEGITQSLRGILKKGLDIDYILLVGGFAQSQILRTHITEEFMDDCEVLCPFRPQEVILRGAVAFGRNPAEVASRKSSFTYGVAVSERFDASRHSFDKKYTNKEGEWCKNIFSKLVKIDEDVGWDEVRKFSFYPIEANQTVWNYTFYRTTRTFSQYVDEDGISQIGEFSVDSPNTARGMDRKAVMNIVFGFTEMKATVTDLDSNTTNSVKLQFMSR